MHSFLVVALILCGTLGFAFIFAALAQFFVHVPVDFLPPLRGGMLVISLLFPLSTAYLLLRAVAASIFHWNKYPEAHLSAYLGMAFWIVSVAIIMALR